MHRASTRRHSWWLKGKAIGGHASATPKVRVSATRRCRGGPQSSLRPVGRLLQVAGVCVACRSFSSGIRRASLRGRAARWSSARSASPSRTSWARSSPRRWPAAGRPAQHRQGLGNTGILEQALASGAVDLYPEYTGTIVRELLKQDGNPSLDELNRWLAPRGLKAAVPFGFNNTYALAMTAAKARELRITRISDLFRADAPQLEARPVARVPAARRRLAGAAARPTALPASRRSASTTAWPTTPSPPAGST